MPPLRDLSGLKFGHLTVLYYVGESRWRCECDCADHTIVDVFTRNLHKGNSTSCGSSAHRAKHGMAHTHVNHVWRGMRARCNNPNDQAYANYGGRGIKVCERWDSFENFLSDMGERPDGYEIDREDNNGDYEPTNCKWATKKANLNNKRTNRMVTWQGETLSVAAWAERLGIHPRTLANRIGRGWTIERAIERKVQQRTK